MPGGHETDEMDRAIGFKMAKLVQRMKQELRRAYLASGLDVTPEQWAVLNKLFLNGGLSQSELAEQTWKDKPTITRILDTLEKRGLVVRGRDQADRRRYRVHLTMAGVELRDKLLDVTRAQGERLAKGFDEQEIEGLRRSFDRMLSNLE